MIVKYILIHSAIPNYTKLAFNSLKMIQNDSLSANQTGDDRPLKDTVLMPRCNGLLRQPGLRAQKTEGRHFALRDFVNLRKTSGRDVA